MTTEERVVLVDEHGAAIGTAAKAEVHSEHTPLHLAFSCYVFDRQGRLLLTRRALGKPTWPGVWTNSFCGHPAPGEPMSDAVRRRAADELGLALESLRLVIPEFRYTATMTNGVQENELCPVFTAVAASEPQPDPEEVEAIAWAHWAELRDEVLSGEREVSPWCVEQVAALSAREDSTGGFHPGDPDRLPPAALAEDDRDSHAG